MEQGIDIFWLILAMAIALTVRGLYRKLRYRHLLALRARRHYPVKVLNYIQLKEVRL